MLGYRKVLCDNLFVGGFLLFMYNTCTGSILFMEDQINCIGHMVAANDKYSAISFLFPCMGHVRQQRTPSAVTWRFEFCISCMFISSRIAMPHHGLVYSLSGDYVWQPPAIAVTLVSYIEFSVWVPVVYYSSAFSYWRVSRKATYRYEPQTNKAEKICELIGRL